MIDTVVLSQMVADYNKECIARHKRPRRHDIALLIGCSEKTISNVLKGYYGANKPYTDTPMILRVIDNKDFEILRDLFGVDGLTL